ncbi:MAG: GNAT family N-acetyltransferase [Candidatus Binatus sp.]|uniref:GNAT family N-acetyltransferase n=1 Tax=Candidatus Binatus sp. TaxID=2811406 RepID=UPI002727F0F8|nr:GNAT family N-acetyltransferase [Candidatus Binatus sp.]MDO8434793.1 GNAT family N-acetyltransferase [Candidatus Binatus sp.]
MNQQNRSMDAAPEIRIRKARESDLPELIRLYEQLHLGDYSYRPPSLREMRTAFRAIARDRAHHLLVATLDSHVVGTLHVLIFRHLGHGLHPVAIVENVVVLDTMRSQRIGEQLIDEAARIAERNRCYKLSLTTNLKRRHAHRFYERLGWSKTHFGYSFSLD